MDSNLQPATDFPSEDSPYAPIPVPPTFSQARDPKVRPNVYPRPNCDPEKTAIIPAATSQAYPLDPTYYFRGQDVTQERRMRDKNHSTPSASSATPPPASQSAEALPYASSKSSKKPSKKPSRQSSSRGSTVPRHLATSGAWSPAARQPRPQKPSDTRNKSHSPY